VPAGRYHILGKGSPLARGRGVSDTYVTEAQIFLKKGNPKPPPFDIANEYVAAELGRLLRLPVPPSFVADLPGGEGIAFCSLGFNLAAEQLPPCNPAEVAAAEPNLASGIIVFDIWIANSDRHTRNLSYQATRAPHRLNVFDHSHALLRDLDSLSWNRGRLGSDGARGARHCLLDHVETGMHFPGWIERVQSIPQFAIKAIVEDAKELGLSEELTDDLIRFLLERRDDLHRLIAENRAEFPRVRDWSLL
jgi:hypothetical protein